MSNNASKAKARKARRAFVSEAREDLANWAFYIPTYDEYVAFCAAMGYQDAELGWSGYTPENNMSQDRYKLASKSLAYLVAKTTDFGDVIFFNCQSELPQYGSKWKSLVSIDANVYNQPLSSTIKELKENEFFTGEMEAIMLFVHVRFTA